MKNIIPLLLIFSLVVACSSKAVNPPVDNIIEINKMGDAKRPGPGEDMDYEAHIKNVLDTHGKTKIAIYIHGGLNTTNDSECRAEKLAENFSAKGYHPIFVHWRSGLGTTYWEHLWNHRQGEYWMIWGPITSPLVLVTDLGTSIFRTPMIWWYQLVSLVRGMGWELPQYANALSVSDKLVVENTIDYDPGVDLRGNGLKNVQGVMGVREFANSMITAPIFDAVGTNAWDVMNRRTDVMFAKPVTNDFLDTYSTISEFNARKTGSLRQFFETLAEAHKTKLKDVEIILIGHSMGTIIASEVLARRPEINFSKIIYMAAACSIKDYELSVQPYLKKHPNTQFYNYMLHPKAENYETHLLGFGGTGSLLVQIDNFYANPVSERERTLGKWENVMNGFNYFSEDIYPQLHFRTMDYETDYKKVIFYHSGEKAKEPVKHGDFGDPDGFAKTILDIQ